MEFSRIVTDYGNKYIQPIAFDTPKENVLPVILTPTSTRPLSSSSSQDPGQHTQRREQVHTKGIRMEDYATVKQLPSGGAIIVVCDGHGAVELTPTRLVGGFETAKFVADTLVDQLASLATRLEGDVTNPNIPLYIQQIFKNVQELLMQEYEKGAEPVYFIATPQEQYRRVSLLPEAAHEEMYRIKTESRKQLLAQSAIDGFHFNDILYNYDGFMRQQEQLGRDLRTIVTDKILLPIQNPKDSTKPVHVAFYTNMHGEILAELDYGCTCTAAILLPDGVGNIRMYVAHVGDSDAYVFPEEKISENGRSTTLPIRVVADHTVSNPEEVLRLEPYGVYPKAPYFHIANPLPICISRAIMPSRTFGHSLFRHYGLISDPHVATDVLQPGETLVVGTDGLWDERWNAQESIRFYLVKHNKNQQRKPQTQSTLNKKVANSAINSVTTDTNTAEHINNIISSSNSKQPNSTFTRMKETRWLNKVGANVLSELKSTLPVLDNIAFVIVHCPVK